MRCRCIWPWSLQHVMHIVYFATVTGSYLPCCCTAEEGAQRWRCGGFLQPARYVELLLEPSRRRARLHARRLCPVNHLLLLCWP